MLITTRLRDRHSERTLQQDYFVCKQSGMAGQWPLSTDSKQIFFEILFTQLADALGDIKTLFSVLFRFGDFDVALSCLCGGEQLVGGTVGWSHSPTLLPLPISLSFFFSMIFEPHRGGD